MHQRAPTLIGQQLLACETLRFRWFSEAQRRTLLHAIRSEIASGRSKPAAHFFTWCWMGDHRSTIVRKRSLGSGIATECRQYDALGRQS